MDTKFLTCLLIISLCILFTIYILQISPKETFLPIILDTCLNRNLKVGSSNLPNGIVYEGMPVHRVGPVINFHQKFKANLPELGWRRYYLNTYNDYKVPRDKSFDGYASMNFLNNLENVDNIYRKCD